MSDDELAVCVLCDEAVAHDEGDFDEAGDFTCDDCAEEQADAAIEWCEAVLSFRAMKDERSRLKGRVPPLAQQEWRDFQKRFRAAKFSTWKGEERYRMATGRPPFALRDEDEVSTRV